MHSDKWSKGRVCIWLETSYVEYGCTHDLKLLNIACEGGCVVNRRGCSMLEVMGWRRHSRSQGKLRVASFNGHAQVMNGIEPRIHTRKCV
ncbi:hypothetical protein LENED_012083 [Lentinula edodes]|uniref:Uncharacterized protein n=1 Tax=Lentinula edodes TaxID=5353 RepID=A0A1Q3ERY1_LENED|nr:hypothetical protein LENED_012083 [Lentinula edodes]